MDVILRESFSRRTTEESGEGLAPPPQIPRFVSVVTKIPHFDLNMVS